MRKIKIAHYEETVECRYLLFGRGYQRQLPQCKTGAESEGFNRPSPPTRPPTEAPQLMEMTLTSSFLLTVVITSRPFWRLPALLTTSLRQPIFSTYNVNQLQEPQISHQYMYIIPPPYRPRVRIHSRGAREVRRAAGCYHWSKAITLIHA
jgi:hypothetical protein